MEQKPKPSIVDCIRHQDFFKPLFKDLRTWKSWTSFLKALYGLEMDEKDAKLYHQSTQRKTLPNKPFHECYAIIGRRGGKSFISALIAVYMALFGGFEKHLAAGERGYIFIIATDKEQGKIVLGYIKGILELFPDIVEADLAWELRLNNRINIVIKTANYRTGRGFSTACIILDELAFYRSENSANPAEEIVNSLLPGLLPGGLMMGISTPYGRFGYLYETFRDCFGDDASDILVWKAPTLTMNPQFRQSIIERLSRRKKGKFAMRAEFDAEFRADIESYLSEEEIDLIVNKGMPMLPPVQGVQYFAFTDPSGGRVDSFTLAVAHEGNGGVVTIDNVQEARPPFDPKVVTTDFCNILKNYKCHEVFGDKFGGTWVSSAFKENGINYKPSPLSKSDLYLEFQPLVKMQRVSILDNEKLKLQLQSLERKTRSGGRDIVDHPPGLHDDVANSCVGASFLVAQKIAYSCTPEELAARLPLIGKREETLNLTKAKISAKEELRKSMESQRPLRPGELGYIQKRVTKNINPIFPPEILSTKTYRRGKENQQTIKEKQNGKNAS